MKLAFIFLTRIFPAFVRLWLIVALVLISISSLLLFIEYMGGK